MKTFFEMSEEERSAELKKLREQYEKQKALGLHLDMSRGKPDAAQLDLSMDMLRIDPDELLCSQKGSDVRNYGDLAGLDAARVFFADLLGVRKQNIIVGGQSSLALMYDTFIKAWVFGVCGGSRPWGQQGKVRFLCPVPGYDRHFKITKEFGVEMINIPMSETGPDMTMVRRLVESDPSVKGIWCVPKYSNPTGVTYSSETVEAFASLRPAADDFRIFWDNAYFVHGFKDKDDELANIFEACAKYGSEDMVYEFVSTSKVTFPGAGVTAFAASEANVQFLLKQIGIQTIGYDKINQLLHVRFLKDAEGLKAHMKKQAAFLRPKFECVETVLARELCGTGIGQWTDPNGGYFISYNGLPGTARRCVQLCADAGVKLTPAGAAFPCGVDPEDRNIRIAPSYPGMEELFQSMCIFSTCQKIAALEILQREN